MNHVPAPLAARFRTGSLAARLLAPVLEIALPKGTVDVVVRSGPAAGIRLPIDPLREKYYWTGAFELEVQRAIQRLLKPGACFWDVGAHIGFFTTLAARLVGPAGRVCSFEPLAANRVRLLRTVALNRLERVDVLRTALADRRGLKWLHQHESTSMWSLVGDNDGCGVEVPCVTLDEVFVEGTLGIPTLIKIDAEGAELDVLRGGVRLVTETSVALIVEFNNAKVVDEARSLLPGHLFEAVSGSHWLLRKAT